VIASVTQPFCRGCTRARLSADGKLYTCLFAGAGHDLRGPPRAGAGDQALREQVAAIWTRRADRYSELGAGPARMAVSRSPTSWAFLRSMTPIPSPSGPLTGGWS
jgi:cyclic pyranopterin phosphate synthase